MSLAFFLAVAAPRTGTAAVVVSDVASLTDALVLGATVELHEGDYTLHTALSVPVASSSATERVSPVISST